ncbi:MAG TPA: zinc-finger domain-containing protein [Sphingomicrobium sp.]
MSAIPPPETIYVDRMDVACDGSGEVAPALGHPRVYLRVDPELGYVECGYCDRRFVLRGGVADKSAA